MSVTCDLIPRLPGEAAEDAIARIYEGGVRFVVGDDGRAYCEEIATGIEPAPEGAFDEWRAEVDRRVAALAPWSVEDEDGVRYFWRAECGWQVELHDDRITLRHRFGGGTADEPSDADLLAVFDGLHTILHWPDDGAWYDLDDPDDRPDPIG